MKQIGYKATQPSKARTIDINIPNFDIDSQSPLDYLMETPFDSNIPHPQNPFRPYTIEDQHLLEDGLRLQKALNMHQ